MWQNHALSEHWVTHMDSLRATLFEHRVTFSEDKESGLASCLLRRACGELKRLAAT